MAMTREKRKLSGILNNGPLLFDGAMGSELANRGVLPNQSFDEINLSRPELVRAIHTSYVDAGATVLQANTFGAHRRALEHYGLGDRTEEINRAAVALAREAAGERALVAGSVSASGCHIDGHDSVDPDDHGLPDSYAGQIRILREAGVDLLVLESFEHLDVLELALAAARQEAPDLPVVAQMRFVPGSDTDPETVGRIATTLRDGGADIVGANCGLDPVDMYDVLKAMKAALPDTPLSAQPSIGTPRDVGGRRLYSVGPDLFATYAKRFLNLGVHVIGGCCGTTPEHIRAMSGAVRFTRNRVDSPGSSIRVVTATATETPTPARAAVPVAERTGLGAAFGTQFVTSVEVKPPAGLDVSKAVRTAQRLIDGGATVVNTTDGARAALRMDNLAFASIVQQQVGCEVILHVCCRDRNTLGQMAHVMASHAMGVHNLVVITGDPPKMGDFPEASAVYDMDSIGLLRILSGMNAGIDPAGREMKTATKFLLGTGAEPAAVDYAREIERLYRKKEAGADFVMTQPVYDPVTMERFLAGTRDLGLPVLMGIVPLASARNAEFLHANVPGMSVPDDIRARMTKAGNGPDARQEGIRIAIEAISAVQDQLAGAYIIPPLGQFDSAIEIIQQITEPGR